MISYSYILIIFMAFWPLTSAQIFIAYICFLYQTMRVKHIFSFSEQEAVEQQKKEKETATLVTTTSAPYTPDYAAGLVSPAPSVSVKSQF